MMDAQHPVLTHRNGDQCIWLESEWFVPLDAGGEGTRCENLEHKTDIPHGFARWEYGDTRPAFPHAGIDAHIEWGASVGMTHRYEYDEHNASHRRRMVTFPPVFGPEERIKGA